MNTFFTSPLSTGASTFAPGFAQSQPLPTYPGPGYFPYQYNYPEPEQSKNLSSRSIGNLTFLTSGHQNQVNLQFFSGTEAPVFHTSSFSEQTSQENFAPNATPILCPLGTREGEREYSPRGRQMQEELTRTRAELEKTQIALTSAETNLSQTTAELHLKRREHSDLTQKFKEAKPMYDNLLNQNRTLTTQNIDLQRQLREQTLITEQSSLQHYKHNSTQNIGSGQMALSLAKKTGALDAASQRNVELQMELAATQQQNKEQAAIIEQLQKELAATLRLLARQE